MSSVAWQEAQVVGVARRAGMSVAPTWHAAHGVPACLPSRRQVAWLKSCPYVSTPSWQARQSDPNVSTCSAVYAGSIRWWQEVQVDGSKVVTEPRWQSAQANPPPRRPVPTGWARSE